VRNSGELFVCKLDASAAHHVNLIFFNYLEKFGRLSLKKGPLDLRAKRVNQIDVKKLTSAISILP
jgi:hypothetical protein